ncbi:MAG: FAD-binding oxidoreductase [Bdellovibrio sp.]
MSHQLFLGQLRILLKADQIVSSGKPFSDLNQSTLPQTHPALAFIYPESAQEVQHIVRLANQYGVKISTSSQGRNWGYGSRSSPQENNVILLLSRMNRILEINDQLAYAVLEPGVTYRQLRDHLEKNHPTLWSDTTDGPPDGSVIGNALDRGLGITEYSDHFGTLCGMQVVLANGEMIHTGGGLEKCPTWPTHKWGVGPVTDGLFTQSNFGIVCKAGMWLMRKPSAFKSFTVDLSSDAKVLAVIDILRELSLTGVIKSATHIVNDICTLAVLAHDMPDVAKQKGRLPEEVKKLLLSKLQIPAWSFGGGLAGTKEEVASKSHQIRRAFKGLGRVTFFSDRELAGIRALINVFDSLNRVPRMQNFFEWLVRQLLKKSMTQLRLAPHIHSLTKGKPSDFFVRHAYFKSSVARPAIADPDRDHLGFIWFAPIVPMTSEHLKVVLDICQPLFEKYDFDFYFALLVQNSRSLICLQNIFFDRSNPAEAQRAQALYKSLTEALHDKNYQQYRVGLSGMPDLYKGNPSYQNFLNTIKVGLDPNKTLSPGKYGIE